MVYIFIKLKINSCDIEDVVDIHNGELCVRVLFGLIMQEMQSVFEEDKI